MLKLKVIIFCRTSTKCIIIIQSVKICNTCLALLYHEELNINARIKILSHLTLELKTKHLKNGIKWIQICFYFIVVSTRNFLASISLYFSMKVNNSAICERIKENVLYCQNNILFKIFLGSNIYTNIIIIYQIFIKKKIQNKN